MKNKIVGIVSLILILIIAGSILACSLFQKKYTLEIEAPTFIKVLDNNNNETTFNESSEEYKKIWELFNDSLQTSFLTALFSGKAFNNTTFEECSPYVSIEEIKSSSNAFVHFTYNTRQTIKLNGNTITTKHGTTEYLDLFVEVSNSDGINQINVYIQYLSGEYTNNNCCYKFVTNATQSELYEYVAEFRKSA